MTASHYDTHIRNQSGVSLSLTSVGSVALYLDLVMVWLFGGLSILFARRAVWSHQAVDLDLPHVFPTGYWICLIAGIVLGVLVIALGRNEVIVTSAVAGITFMVAPAFLLGVFPAVSGWDSYVHASSALSLGRGDGIPDINFYARQYPGPATLLATVAEATQIDSIMVEILITILVQLALVLVFMAIARRFMGLRASAWSALGVLALTPAVITNEHYSQWIIGYLAIWCVALLLFGVLQSERSGLGGTNVAALLLIGAAIASHPFLPLIAGAVVAAVALWSWFQRLGSSAWIRSFLTTAAVATVAWMIYVATTYFENGIKFFQFALFDTQDVVESWAPLSLAQVLQRASDPGFALIMTRWSAYVLVGLLALTGLGLRRRREDVFLLFWVASFSVLSVVIGFASEAPWIQRVLYLVPPFLVIASAIAIQGWAERLRLDSAPARCFGGLVMISCLLAGFFLWHPPTMLYSVHPGNNGFLIWPQERAVTQFASEQMTPDETVGSDLQTMIVYSFAQPEYPVFEHGFSLGDNLHERIEEHPLMFDGTLVIRSARQEMMAYQAQDVPPEFWAQLDRNLASETERIYDNGFASIHRANDR